MLKLSFVVSLVIALFSSTPNLWGQTSSNSSVTQAADTCKFWFRVLDSDLRPIHGAEVRVIYGLETVDGLTTSDGDYRGEIPCDTPSPYVDIEVRSNNFADYDKTAKLTASRVLIKLSPVATPTPNPVPTSTPTALTQLPTSTGAYGPLRCPFWFQVFDTNLAPIFGAQVKVIYRLDLVEGFTDSDGEYQGEIPCDVQNPKVDVQIRMNGTLVLKKTLRLVQSLQPLQITNLATATSTSTISPTPTPTSTSTPVAPFEQGDCVEADVRLRLRELPGKSQRLVEVLEQAELFMVIDGPEYADDYSWWELGELDRTSRGWAAYIEVDGEKTLYQTPCQSPTATSVIVIGTPVGAPTPNQPPTATPAPLLEISDPRPGQSIVGKCEVRWRYTGVLAAGQGFDLILRYAPDANDRKLSRGVTGAQEIVRKLVNHGNGEYSVVVDFSQAPSVKQFGDTSYYLSVTVAQLEPFARIGSESPGVDIRISPDSIEGCKKA